MAQVTTAETIVEIERKRSLNAEQCSDMFHHSTHITVMFGHEIYRSVVDKARHKFYVQHLEFVQTWLCKHACTAMKRDGQDADHCTCTRRSLYMYSGCERN